MGNILNPNIKEGDKAMVRYISDCHPYNSKVGIVTWLHPYNYYPNGDLSVVEQHYQLRITFGNGDSISAGITGSHYDAVKVDDSEPVFKGI